MVRSVTGVGEGNGPYVCIHDGFEGTGNWAGFMNGADRMCLDTHPYIAFSTQSNAPIASFASQPCSSWGAEVNTSMSAFGVTVAGEWRFARLAVVKGNAADDYFFLKRGYQRLRFICKWGRSRHSV